jgi:bifunctional non-homologous end joining protein LigD
MAKRMQTLAMGESPFVERVPKRDALFVRPETVVQVEYRRKTPGGMIHQASFKGLRTDKKAKDVRGEG